MRANRPILKCSTSQILQFEGPLSLPNGEVLESRSGFSAHLPGPHAAILDMAQLPLQTLIPGNPRPSVHFANEPETARKDASKNAMDLANAATALIFRTSKHVPST